MKTIPLEQLLAEQFTAEERAQIRATADRLFREMLLAEVRELTGKTQSEVAKRLGIRQPSLSKIERQSDMKLSTLSGLAEAYGGKLRVVIDFPDRDSVPIVLTKPMKRKAVQGTVGTPKRRAKKPAGTR